MCLVSPEGKKMASRCGSLRLSLLSSTAWTPSTSPSRMLPPVGFLRDHGNKRASMKGAGRKTAVQGVCSQAKANLVVEEVKQKNKGPDVGIALCAIVGEAARAALNILTAAASGRESWALQAEKIVESAIINCRFFTLIGVAGTLVGSILCFVEGCSLIVEAYLEYFHAVWEKLDQGEVTSLLIEAVDMFLVGSAMLNFGMGLYTMFIGSRGSKRYSRLHPRLAMGLHQRMLPSAMEMQCISEAKAKLGHAVLTMLQSGVVGKLKDVQLESGLDLACFAGAVLVSSAGVFLLSHLHTKLERNDHSAIPRTP